MKGATEHTAQKTRNNVSMLVDVISAKQLMAVHITLLRPYSVLQSYNLPASAWAKLTLYSTKLLLFTFDRGHISYVEFRSYTLKLN